ncbi:MAG: hypothetical protein KIT09_29685 [Bryobacteraceae bacterium]|nr:hypothetical protein [Bryobacteraceae bacterium]
MNWFQPRRARAQFRAADARRHSKKVFDSHDPVALPSMDRERWSQVVMGESYTPDFSTTEQLAQRVEFPEPLAHSLAFRLEVE